MPTDPLQAKAKRLFFKVEITPLEITSERWITLVTDRCAKMKPHLEHVTLGQLGDQKIGGGDFGQDRIRDGKPSVHSDPPGSSLATQGIFDLIKPMETSPDGSTGRGVMDLWGLTRNGDWLVVKVFFIYDGIGGGKAENVTIRKVNFIDLIVTSKADPQEVWETLGKAVSRLVESRRKQYEAVKALGEQIRIENEMAEEWEYQLEEKQKKKKKA